MLSSKAPNPQHNLIQVCKIHRFCVGDVSNFKIILLHCVMFLGVFSLNLKRLCHLNLAFVYVLLEYPVAFPTKPQPHTPVLEKKKV